jgi:acetyltransferase-like isoleucine patch superfamily enzyme
MFEQVFRGCADLQVSLGGCWSSKTRTRIFGNVEFGKNVSIDDGVLIEASKEVVLGNDTAIGARVVILNTGYSLNLQKQLDRVVVSSGVRIGPGALICPGVEIGENAVVCPGAVVSSDVPAGKIVSGHPATISGDIERKAEPAFPNKRRFSFSGSVVDAVDRRTFRERLSFRRKISNAEVTERTYVPIGRTVEIGYDTIVEGEGDVLVGQGVSIGHRVTICTTEHNMARAPFGSEKTVRPVVIEDGAKIESGSIILPGIKVGENAVVKAGSVVTRSVTACSEVNGNPAKSKQAERNHEEKLEPQFSVDFADLSEKETRDFVEIRHLYNAYLEKTYGIKPREKEFIFVNRDVFLGSANLVKFGGNALIAPRAMLVDDYCSIGLKDAQEISIGDDVWVGAGAMVLFGVTLGDGAVVGAGAVVGEDVPANTVVLGNPAKPFKQRVVTESVRFEDMLSHFERVPSFQKRLADSMKVKLVRFISR